MYCTTSSATQISTYTKIDSEFKDERLALHVIKDKIRCQPPTAIIPKITIENMTGSSPTETWIKIHQTSTNEKSIPGWSEEDINSLPVDINELIRVEKEHKDTHIPLYHAHPRYLLAYRLLSEEILKEANTSEWHSSDISKITWIRSPLQDPPKNGHRYGSVEEVAIRYGLFDEKSLKGDNSEECSWQLLSCNPSLFQNTNIASEESTADYLFNGMEVSPPDMRKWFDDISLYLEKNIDANKHIKELLDLCNEYCDSDVLLQILIPNEYVNQIAYISKERGIIDSNNRNAFDTLKSLQNLDTIKSIKNYNSLQVRLSTTLMIDPGIGPKIKVVEYGNISKDPLRMKIREIAKSILE